MATKTGLATGAQLRRGGVARSGVVAAVAAAGGGIEQVPTAALMANPENPAGRVAAGPELEQLTTAVGEWGVLSPLIVAPVAALSSRAGFTAAPGAQWVVLDGHRRHAAATAAGVETVPVVVREDLAQDDAAVMVLTDAHKVRLTPIEEARAYQRLVDSGLTQGKISTRLGVSQPVVSKRLALLRLSPLVQDLVSEGRVPVNEAAHLVTDDPDLRAAIDKEIEGQVSAGNGIWGEHVVRRAEYEVEKTQSLARAVAEAEERGVELVTDPYRKWSQDVWRRELNKAEDVKAAAEAGTLAVAVGTPDKPRFFTTAALQKTSTRSSADDVEKQRRAATKNRRAWLTTWLPTVKPGSAEVQQRLLDHVLDNHKFDSNGFKVASQILSDAGVEADLVYYRPDGGPLAQAAPKARPRLAYLLSLMLSEVRLSQPYGSVWKTAFDRGYMDVIVAAGYQPTTWEQEQLAADEEEGR